MKKLPLWKEASSFGEAEKNWDEGAKAARKICPLKIPKSLPSMVGITPETQKGLKWKSLKWMIKEDKNRAILKNILQHPFKYPLSFLKSVFKKSSYIRDDDFFLYGIKNVDEFKILLKKPNVLLVAGFSYCHKPHECPSGRFTTSCIHDSENPVCRQCYIGKCVNALPENNVKPLFITTIHYIGEEIFKLVHANPNKQVIFIITACEMTLQMFGDFGNMVGIKGIGVRLDGRICNTMKAFELSEQGIKPGLTVVLDHTQKRILDLLRLL
ncbi:MAG: hypothetical protein P4L16_06225 [Chlamydiales bacterium]|nr:hypothetical protein [Chlamydiales bacterium]